MVTSLREGKHVKGILQNQHASILNACGNHQ
jgi:hypothetical protein